MTREYGLAHNITPTGRRIAVISVPGTAMWQLKFSDGAGELPDSMKQRFTSFPTAQRALYNYLVSFWDMSDKQSKK